MIARTLIVIITMVSLIGDLYGGEDYRKKFQKKKAKLIAAGWNLADTKYLSEHWQEMEAKNPFDGIVFTFNIKVNPDTNRAYKRNAKTFGKVKNYGRHKIMGKYAFQKEWFEESINDMKKCKFKTFTDNFVVVKSTPGNVDWFDDEGWSYIANNLGIISWFAKQTGSKGIFWDGETYSARMFRYDSKKGKSFVETLQQVRKRGGEVMKAMAKEYPEQTFLGTWLFSMVQEAGFAKDPLPELKAHTYGLFSAFLNGMMDELPETMRLIDGNEHAYKYSNPISYLKSYNQIKNPTGPCMRLVEEENYTKYVSQVNVGFGFYVDAYFNPKGSYWRIEPPVEEPRLKTLERNLKAAIQASDSYVWLWAEQCCFWPYSLIDDHKKKALKKSIGKGRPWTETMPGILQAIEKAKDYDKFIEKVYREGVLRETLKNIAFNSSFKEDLKKSGPDWEEKVIPGFAIWYDKRYKDGKLSIDRTFGKDGKSSAKAEMFKHGGCYIQKHDVKPDQAYAIEADMFTRGNAKIILEVRWLDKNKKWLNGTGEERKFAFVGKKDQWQKASGIVKTPDSKKLGKMVILLRVVGGQYTPKDTCWFDNLKVYRLD